MFHKNSILNKLLLLLLLLVAGVSYAQLRPGVYQATNQMFLAHSANHFSLVNREQDLNDEGLRKAKLSYHPAEFLRKYRVTLNGTLLKDGVLSP